MWVTGKLVRGVARRRFRQPKDERSAEELAAVIAHLTKDDGGDEPETPPLAAEALLTHPRALLDEMARDVAGAADDPEAAEPSTAATAVDAAAPALDASHDASA